MRAWLRICGLSLIVVLSSGGGTVGAEEPSPGTPPRITSLSSALRAKILNAMRRNRRAFQDDAVLARYGERRPASDPAFATCELPRTADGGPAATFPAAAASKSPYPYSETKVADCLGTTGGLAGTKASPLQQHYYCSLPGLSPDVRACFTFQLRLPGVSRTRSVWGEGFTPDGKKIPIEKTWKFAGSDPSKLPDAGAVFNSCVVDGRPASMNTLKDGKREPLDVARIHPKPTRPMCWVAQTQADVFQGIMGGAIDVPLAEQRSLIREYYECDSIKSKVSAARFRALCG